MVFLVIQFFLVNTSVELFVMKEPAIWKEESRDVELNVKRLKAADILVKLPVTQPLLAQKTNVKFSSRFHVTVDIVKL